MEKVNESVNAQISFTDFSLSIFKNFPNATVELEGLKVINNAPFAGALWLMWGISLRR